MQHSMKQFITIKQQAQIIVLLHSECSLPEFARKMPVSYTCLSCIFVFEMLIPAYTQN